ERPGQQQDDERPQRDLAEQERPVIGKHLAHEDTNPARPAEPVVQPPAGAAQGLRDVKVGVTHGQPPARLAGPSPRPGPFSPGLVSPSSVRPSRFPAYPPPVSKPVREDMP